MQDQNPHTNDDDLDVPLWTAQAIADAINCDVRRARWLIQNKRLDVSRSGRLLVSTKRRLRRSLEASDG